MGLFLQMYTFIFKKVVCLFIWKESFSLSATLLYRLCELLSKWTCPTVEGVRHEEKHNGKSSLHWGSTGTREVKGLHLMERGRSVSLDKERATSQWKLPCWLWEASQKMSFSFFSLSKTLPAEKALLPELSFPYQIWVVSAVTLFPLYLKFLLLLCQFV